MNFRCGCGFIRTVRMNSHLQFPDLFHAHYLAALPSEKDNRMDAGGRAPTVGTLGDAGQKNAPAFSAFMTSLSLSSCRRAGGDFSNSPLAPLFSKAEVILGRILSY